ncbi:CGNR zinc finger domain-containing protein [Anderseniella sp. Alg231-50]|uniref:CGNR zinc finger domain-containing protein n=1 Tax=Anderseniella sp. Alg231-50 TaxID=1922226 RepID=UPI000D54C485
MSYQTHPIRLIGGRTCLDFLNTADWTPGGDIVEERLACADDLVVWCDAVGLRDLVMPGNERLQKDVLEFRNTLRSIVVALVRGNEPAMPDIEDFNRTVTRTETYQLMKPARDGLAFGPQTSFTKAISLLAVSLLSDTHEIGRVKMCPSDNCGWLFLDESKNRRRQWCAMDLCGNRAKARRHYQRHGVTQ